MSRISTGHLFYACQKFLIWYTRFCQNYGGYRQVVKTSDCGSDIRGFESHYPPHLQKLRVSAPTKIFDVNL